MVGARDVTPWHKWARLAAAVLTIVGTLAVVRFGRWMMEGWSLSSRSIFLVVGLTLAVSVLIYERLAARKVLGQHVDRDRNAPHHDR